MRIGIGIPTPEHIDPEFGLISLPQLIGYTRQQRPDIELKLSTKAGVRTDSNRNFILKTFLEFGVDYVLWLDADMVYPKDLIIKYLKDPKDVMGCVYYRRDPPHTPVVYIENKERNRNLYPFTSVEPKSMPQDQFVKVDGIGFGGMMVNIEVYKKLGDKKWHSYGENFHIPYEMENKLSHDLQFCTLLKENKIDINVHTGVRAGHIAKKIVFDYEPAKKSQNLVDINSHQLKKQPKIAVLLPSINLVKAKKTVEQLKTTSNYINASYFILNDEEEHLGFIGRVNNFTNQFINEYDYFVYLAQDAFGGRDWLKIAVQSLVATKKHVFCFNDGKWHGSLASFGMVSNEWIIKHNGNLFYPCYKSHYADIELTIEAMQEDQLVYSPESVLIEIDYNKQEKIVNPKDKKKFFLRKMNYREPFRSMFS